MRVGLPRPRQRVRPSGRQHEVRPSALSQRVRPHAENGAHPARNEIRPHASKGLHARGHDLSFRGLRPGWRRSLRHKRAEVDQPP